MTAHFSSRLAGGPRQSIGETDAVASDVLAAPQRGAELWETIASSDHLVHMRAVDALEKVSATRPEVLCGHESEVLEAMPNSRFPEVRWHVGLLIPRLRLEGDQVAAAVQVLERLGEDPSRLVQVNAIDGIVRLARRHSVCADAARAAISGALCSPHAAVRARARRLVREHDPDR